MAWPRTLYTTSRPRLSPHPTPRSPHAPPQPRPTFERRQISRQVRQSGEIHRVGRRVVIIESLVQVGPDGSSQLVLAPHGAEDGLDAVLFHVDRVAALGGLRRAATVADDHLTGGRVTEEYRPRGGGGSRGSNTGEYKGQCHKRVLGGGEHGHRRVPARMETVPREPQVAVEVNTGHEPNDGVPRIIGTAI